MCPVDDVTATAVPTIIRHGDETQAAALRLDGGAVVRSPLPAGSVAHAVTEPGLPDVLAVEVTTPSPALAGGPLLVDTPGVGGLGSAEERAALALGPGGALFVTDAARELSATDLAHLREVVNRVPRVLVVLSRVDLQPAWREVRDADRRHLATAGLDLEIVPVSSALAARGAHAGFGVVRAWLAAVQASAADDAAHAAALEVTATVEALADTFAKERTLLDDPAAAAAATAVLRDAEARAATLKGQGSRWANTLAERFTTINADADHDLRSRLRELAREADEQADAVDPATAWPELERWVRERLAAEVDAHFARPPATPCATPSRPPPRSSSWTRPTVGDGDPAGCVDALVPSRPELAKPGLFAQGLTLLRGSYGSVLMIGALGGLAGLAMATPIVAAVGLALGGRTLPRGAQAPAHATPRDREGRTAAAPRRRHLPGEQGVTRRPARAARRGAHAPRPPPPTRRPPPSPPTSPLPVPPRRPTPPPARSGSPDLDAELARLTALRDRATALLAEVGEVAA